MVAIAAHSARAGYLSAALAVVGSLAGSMFLFYLGRRGGQAYLDKKTEKGWPKRFRQWFHHYGGLAVFIPVLVPAPLPLKVFVLSAGALGMRPYRFALIVFVGRALHYFALAYLGVQMGTLPWHFVKTHEWQLAAISLGIFVLLYAAVRSKDTCASARIIIGCTMPAERQRRANRLESRSGSPRWPASSRASCSRAPARPCSSSPKPASTTSCCTSPPIRCWR